MNLIETFQAKLEQIILKNPEMSFNKDGKVSDILLLRDYLAKLEELKLVLGIEEFYASELSFHNLLVDIIPEWESEKPNYEHLLDFMSERNINTFYLSENFWNGQFIYLFICWEIFKNRTEILQLNIVGNPYESVLKIIERDHLIRMREGFFYINDLIVFKFRRAKLPSLRESFLDFIDDRNPIRRLVEPTVPNKDETMELWKEFQLLNNQ